MSAEYERPQSRRYHGPGSTVGKLTARAELAEARLKRCVELLRESTAVDDELRGLAWQEKVAALLDEAKKDEWCK